MIVYYSIFYVINEFILDRELSPLTYCIMFDIYLYNVQRITAFVGTDGRSHDSTFIAVQSVGECHLTVLIP
jgi:hypothetical protein